MKTKTILLSSTAAIVGIVIASRMMLKPPPPAAVRANAGRAVVPTFAPPTAPAPVPDPPPAPARTLADHALPPEAKLDEIRKVAPATAPAKKPKEPLRDPDARAAMSLVGVDPEAEAYWLGAIFDSNLPDGEREDLMEDLNEEGLSDPKHPGPQDYPLILNRLAILEDIVPHADEFMLSHLAEAYKDLANLAALAQGGGEPVR